MSESSHGTALEPAQLADREKLAQTMKTMSAGGDDFSVLMVDINHLGKLNESEGRPAGDQVMRSVADLLAEFADEPLPLVYLGEDDFALLLPNTNKLQAMIASTQIQGKAVVSGVKTDNWQLAVNVGVATSDEAEEPDAILVKAEQRLLEEMKRLNDESGQKVQLNADSR